MKVIFDIRNTVLTAGIIALLGFSAHANASSSCKGLDTSACSSKAACSWVQGYERKDGRTVKSFCRTQATGKKATAKKVAKNQVSGSVTGKKTSN